MVANIPRLYLIYGVRLIRFVFTARATLGIPQGHTTGPELYIMLYTCLTVPRANARDLKKNTFKVLVKFKKLNNYF